MEVTVAFLVVLISYLIVVLVRWFLNRRGRFKIFERYGIPGPRPSFFTGNLSHLRAASTSNEVITGWLKKYGNIFGYYLGESPFIVVKDLDVLKQVFIKDFHVFYNRPDRPLDSFPINKSLIALEGKRWKEVRSLLTPTFTSGKIKLMTHITTKKVDVTVSVVAKKAEENEMFDMYEVVQGLTLDVIADCALAIKCNCQNDPQDPFKLAVRDFFRFGSNIAVKLSILFPFIGDMMIFLNKFLTSGKMTSLIVGNVRTAIDARRKNPEVRSIDFLQLLLDHRDGGTTDNKLSLTDDEIIANAFVFLLAGYETTATALAYTFYLLIKHPEIQERLYNEIQEAEDASYNTIQNLQYLDQVFSESLRYYPPVTGFVSRACDRDHQVGSLKVPKGAQVLAPVWDIHHDPDLWPDPWTFDPDRFSQEKKASLNSMAYMPFGVGPRNCIGARFAQLEAKLALFKLIKRFRFEMCEKTDDPLTLTCPSVITRPKNGVFLRAVPRTETI